MDEQEIEITEVAPEPEISGVEKRINELVARQKEYEAQAVQTIATKDQQIAQLLAAVAAKAAPVDVTDPLADIAPEDRERVEKIVQHSLAPKLNKLEATIAALTNKLGQQEVAASFAGEDPAILAKAQELMGNWRQSGHTGWAPQDAITFAKGMLLSKSQNAGSGMLTGHGNQPPVAQVVKKSGKPANFDSLSFEEQADILERELGDEPF